MHPIPAVKACVEQIILNGICQYLSESHITTTSSIINKYILTYQSGADLPSEVVALTAAQLLAKILPILGEAIKAQLDEFLGSLLPALSKDSVALQTTVIRSLVMMGNTDASIIEVMIKQLILQLTHHIQFAREKTDVKVREDILLGDGITSYCKAIGELLLLLFTSFTLFLRVMDRKTRYSVRSSQHVTGQSRRAAAALLREHGSRPSRELAHGESGSDAQAASLQLL